MEKQETPNHNGGGSIIPNVLLKTHLPSPSFFQEGSPLVRNQLHALQTQANKVFSDWNS